MVATAARGIVATFGDGGHLCHQFSQHDCCSLQAVTQQSPSSTVHIHASLGGGWPRWQPLNVAVATSAGGECPGRRQQLWGQTTATTCPSAASPSVGSGVLVAWWWRSLLVLENKF
jgi:hypothetical protein